MDTRDLDRIRFVTRHFNDLQGFRYWVPLGLLTLSVGGTTYFDNLPLVALRALLFLGAVLVAFGARRYYRNTFGQIDHQAVRPTLQLSPVSIFSPAGPTPRLEGFPLVAPAMRPLLLTMGLALFLFFILQAISPTISIVESQSLAEPPWLTLDSVFLAEPAYTRGIQSVLSGRLIPSSAAKAVVTQAIYALCGSLFLGVWLWRERRLSQSYYLILGAPLLGLSVVGTFLGYFVYEEREPVIRTLDLFLPAAIHLWIALLLCGSAMIVAGLLDHWQLVRALGRPGNTAVSGGCTRPSRPSAAF